jgi:hypothetical protein
MKNFAWAMVGSLGLVLTATVILAPVGLPLLFLAIRKMREITQAKGGHVGIYIQQG